MSSKEKLGFSTGKGFFPNTTDEQVATANSAQNAENATNATNAQNAENAENAEKVNNLEIERNANNILIIDGVIIPQITALFLGSVVGQAQVSLLQPVNAGDTILFRVYDSEKRLFKAIGSWTKIVADEENTAHFSIIGKSNTLKVSLTGNQTISVIGLYSSQGELYDTNVALNGVYKLSIN